MRSAVLTGILLVAVSCGGGGAADAVCGDGIVQTAAGEVCDDGNLDDGDGCTAQCTLPRCGNGIVEPGEMCDDGNLDDGDACESTCLASACGNGILDEGEECDDANRLDGDGCRHDCRLSGCGDGAADPGEVCLDDGGVLAMPGSGSGVVASADFDGDGYVDLAVGVGGPLWGFVTIFGNDGTGRLEPRWSFPTYGAVAGLAAIDWDADGDSDLVAAVSGDESVLAALENDGTGWFRHADGGSLPSVPRDVEAVDLDGDGHVDVAVAAHRGLVVLFGDGTGGFTERADIASGTEFCCVTSADIDGDGVPDLATAGSTAVYVVSNGGDGTLELLPGRSIDSRPSGLAAADLDGDGAIDLLAVAAAQAAFDLHTVTVLRNDGDGGLSITDQLELGEGRGAAVGDFDGDGALDAAFLSPTGIVVVTGDGSGALGGQVVRLNAARDARDLVPADFDGDGRLDLAFAAAAVAGVFGTASGQLALRHTVATGAGPVAAVVADFDGDGDADLATANERANDVSILDNDGTGAFTLADSVPVGRDPHWIGAGDLDGDGDTDLIVTLGFNGVIALINDAGQFEPGAALPTEASTWGGALGDVDGDNLLDLVVGHTDSAELVVLRGDGAGGFSRLGGVAATGAGAVRLADLDGDGDLDAVASGGSRVVVARNDGGGEFEVTWEDHAEHARELAVVDVDADGAPDLVVAAEPTTRVFRNAGEGRFEPAEKLPYLAEGAAAGDLDGDGVAEVVLASSRSRRLRVLVRAAPAVLAERAKLAAPEGERLEIADVTGDGILDVLGVNPRSDTVSVWRSNP